MPADTSMYEYIPYQECNKLTEEHFYDIDGFTGEKDKRCHCGEVVVL